MKIGVIGAGRFGHLHLQKYSLVKEAKIVGIVETDLTRANQLCREFNCLHFTSLEDFFKEVDAVSICSPTITHYNYIKESLEAGVHVFVEKPMCISESESLVLYKYALDKGLTLQVGHIERFNESLKRAEEKILSGPIIYMETVRTCAYNGRCRDTDVVLDLMIHDIDLVLHYNNSLIESIHAEGEKYYDDGLDKVHARINFTDGTVADMTANRNSLLDERLITFHVGDKLINLNLHQKTNDALLEEVQDFVGAVENGRPPQVTGRDGYEAVRVANWVRQLIGEK
jgi:predicted dehydrogenase